jgi:hypothetical protein
MLSRYQLMEACSHGTAFDDLIGTVTIRCSEMPIDAVSYDHTMGWPSTEGRSMTFSNDHIAMGGSALTVTNDLPGNWCPAPETAASYSTMGAGTNRGSPGEPNIDCTP